MFRSSRLPGWGSGPQALRRWKRCSSQTGWGATCSLTSCSYTSGSEVKGSRLKAEVPKEDWTKQISHLVCTRAANTQHQLPLQAPTVSRYTQAGSLKHKLPEVTVNQ